jgi:3-isopropylmalate/(R)-2-methylmalate dehydratase small subunit
MPCVTTARSDLDAMMTTAAQRPSAVFHIDLQSLECVTDGFRCAVSLPPHTREAFVSGAWDTTGMLLDRFDEVRQVAARLPYLSGFAPAGITPSRPA